MGVRDRYNQKREKENENIKSESTTSSGVRERYQSRAEKRDLETSIGFDTFEADLAEVGNTINSIYSNWQTQETMKNTRSSVESMNERLKAYQTYQSKYGGTDLSELASGYQSVVDDWDNLSSTYGYYQNADAYGKARKKAQYDEQFSGLSYDDVQSKMKEYAPESDEYKYLSTYTGYTNLNDFDKALGDIPSSSGAGRRIGGEGTTDTDKANKEYESYKNELQAARNKYALDNAFDKYAYLTEDADYATDSQYVPTEAKKDIFGKTYFEDEVYEYINNPDRRAIIDVYHNANRVLSGGASMGLTTNQAANYDQMTPEEIGVFNMLWKEDKNKALAFLDDMAMTLDKRATDKVTSGVQSAMNDSWAVAIPLGIASPLISVAGQLEGAGSALGSMITGKEINPYDSQYIASNIGSAASQKFGDKLAESTDFEIGGYNVASTLYGAYDSAMQSGLRTAMFGKAGSALMGTSAYQQRAKELMEEGATEEQIRNGARMSSAFEFLGELWGVSKLLKVKNTDSLWKIAKNAAKHGIEEFEEEAFTESLNLVGDYLNRGDMSDIAKMYQDYIDRGFSEKEAWHKTAGDIGGQVLHAGATGFLSGTMLGGANSAMQYNNLKDSGKQIRENDRVADVFNLAKDKISSKASEAYEAYNEYFGKGVNTENITDAQLGNLYATVAQDADAVRSDREATMGEKVKAYKNIKGLHTVNTVKNSKVTSTGKEATIEGIKVNDGEVTLLTSQGEVLAKDMTLSMEDAEKVAYASNMSAEQANLFMSQYDGKSDAGEFARSLELAYAYGENLMDEGAVFENKGVLTESQALEAYKAGMKNRNSEQEIALQKVVNEINQKYAGKTFVKGVVDESIIDYNSKTTDGSKVNWNRLSRRQRNAITFVKAFSEATGVNITFTKSNIVNGKHVGENGSYDPKTNTITIDVYAGRINAASLNDSIIPTVSHEVTHWMKDKSPEMYAKMREHIIETLSMDGKKNLNERIAEQIAKMEKAHPENKGKISEEDAMDELIARSCEDMLSNSNEVRKMLNKMSVKEQNSFVAKIKETFSNLMDWVNELLGQYKSDSNEAKTLRKYKDRLKELSKMWDKALKEAIQTNQSMQYETAQEFIKDAVVQNMDRESEMDLDATVEMTDDLVAVHNLTEEKLEKTFKLEGFPMPSIAITRASLGHSNFGSISFVFGKDTINPSKKKNKVYAADAWTPTFPRVEYEADTKRTYEIEKELKPLIEKLPERFRHAAQSLVSGLDYNLDNYGGYEGVVERALNDDAIKQLYLATTDDVVEDVMTEKRTEMDEMDIAISKNILEAIEEDISEVTKMTGNEIYDKYGYHIAESMKKVYMENFGFSSEQAQNVIDNSKKIGIVRQFRTAKNYALNGSVKIETEIDYDATRKAINAKIDDAKYEEWVRETFKGIVKNEGLYNGKDLFTPSGNRRSFAQTHLPITADNVVKAMIAQSDDVRNVSGFNGIKSIRAVAVEEFKNLKSLKQARDKLRSIDSIEYEAKNEELSHRLYEVMGEIVNASKRSSGNSFIDMDNVGYAILDACGNPTSSNIKKLLESYSWNVTEAQAKEIESIINAVVNMPVNMFEAKPQRVVGFDEILYAIVPNDISDASRNLIKEKNIPIREYESGNDESRMKVLNSLEGVQFSDREFVKEVDDWNKEGRPDGERLILGSTSDVLQGLGAIESDIYMNSEKINIILEEHPEITLEEIKKIPQILEKPILILASRNVKRGNKTNSRIVMFGSVKAQDGRPMLSVLDLRPVENHLVIDDMQKVSSVYTKDNDPVGYISKSEVLYLDKKRTTSLLRTIGFQMPIELNESGYIGNISYGQQNVKLEGKLFGDVVNTNQKQYADREETSIYDLMGENKNLQKQNAKLSEDVNRLKERLKLEKQITKGNTFNENQLNSAAAHLLNVANSTYSKADLVEGLRDIYSYIVQTPDLHWDDMFVKCCDVAKDVLAKQKPGKITNDYFKSVLNDIRKARISLSEEQIQEAKSAYGNNYRSAFMGRVMITKDGTSLDQKWQEWSYMYPEIFDENITGGDQITALSDIYDDLKDGAEMYETYNDEESIRAFATEIYNQYWNVSTIRTTADKYDKQIKRLNFEHRKAMNEMRDDYKERLKNQKKADAAHYGKVIKDIRARKDNDIKRAKELGKKRLDNYKERVEKNNEIKKITKSAITLNQWLTKNSKDEHIPEVMKAPVAYLLNAIDFSSKQLLGMNGGQFAYSPTKKDVSLSKALEQVHDMVKNINSAQIGENELTEIYGTFADFPMGFEDDIRELSKSVNDIMRTVGDNAYVLNQMSLEELQTLDKIVTTIKSTVTNMNRFLAVRHAEGVANLSQQSIRYLDSLGKTKTADGLVGGAKKLVNWGNALPYYTFKRFGEGSQKVYAALQDGWDKFAFLTKDIIDYAEATYTSDEVKAWAEEVKEFSILEPATDAEMDDPNYEPRYQQIQMSIPQIMSLYCLQKREQAKGHLMGGGMRIADIKTKKGTVSQTEGVILSESDIESIIGILDNRQKEVANALQLFMNTVCTDWGNEVSMHRFGYKAFAEENYFPIQSDKNNLAVNDETEQNNSLFRLLNMSFTKSTIKQANNRIVVSDIFDVFAQHTSDMAKYNALALPILDAFKWYNYKEKAKKGDTQFVTKSLKQSMENAFGKDAQNYFVTFLRDINGEQSAGRDVVGKGFFTNAKIASVGLNMRVVALQPTSYLRASAVIDPKYLAKAFTHKPKIAMAEEHCGMALWKSLGFYDINIQNGVTDLIKHNQTTRDKIVEKSMKGAEWADKVTWGYLWNACEAEVRDTHKNLKVGSDAYYEKVASRLREVIYATQVVDSTMTRSHMMRSKDGWDKMATAFMSEPTLAYNMLQDCYMDWKATERQTGSKKTAFNKHGKKLARVITAYTATNMLSAFIETGFDIFRDDDDEEMTMEEFIEKYLKNLGSNMSILNKIPYAKEVVSMLQGYSSSRTDTQWLQYFTYTVNGVGKLLEGKGNAYTTLKNFMRAFSYGTGLPMYNLWRDSTALLDKTQILDAEDLEDIINDTIGEIFPSLKSK